MVNTKEVSNSTLIKTVQEICSSQAKFGISNDSLGVDSSFRNGRVKVKAA